MGQFTFWNVTRRFFSLISQINVSECCRNQHWWTPLFINISNRVIMYLPENLSSQSVTLGLALYAVNEH